VGWSYPNNFYLRATPAEPYLSPYSKSRGLREKMNSNTALTTAPIIVHPILFPLQPLLLRVRWEHLLHGCRYFLLVPPLRARPSRTSADTIGQRRPPPDLRLHLLCHDALLRPAVLTLPWPPLRAAAQAGCSAPALLRRPCSFTLLDPLDPAQEGPEEGSVARSTGTRLELEL
jgi:hypothetical protein